MSGLFLTPDQMAQNAGLYLSADELAQSAGARGGLASGLTQLGPSADSFAALRDQALARIAPSAGAPGLIPPEAPAYYNPSTNQMFAGGRSFDVRDVGSALQAAQNLTPSAPPPGAGWQPLTGRTYGEFVQSLGQRRGTGELLTRGARSVAGGLVGGVGALAEFAGATDVGGALVRAGETITGQDEFDQQRSALIQRNNSLFANIIDASIEAGPTVVATLLSGGAGAVAGGALAARAAAGAAGAVRAAGTGAGTFLGAQPTTIGGLIGAGVINYPQTVSSLYEAAQNARTPDGRPAYNTSDPAVQNQIMGWALVSSALDAIAPGRVAGTFSRAFLDKAQEVGTNTISGMTRARAVGRASLSNGLQEATTEALQTLIEQAVFDPQFRSQLNASDWKALAPYIVDRYGENILIAAGAGAFLGAGFGGAARFIETRPRDILTDAGAPPAAPPGAVPPAGGPPAPSGPAPITPLPGGGPTPTSDLGPIIQPGALQSAEGLGLPVWNEQLGAYVLPTGPAAAPQQGPQRPGVLPREGVEQFGPTLPSLEGMVTALPPTGPQYGPLRAPPTMPAPQVFPTRPTLAPETFVTPGMERLRRPVPETAAPVTLGQTEVGNRLLALRRQMELQQAQAQAATQPRVMTAAERDYEAALAQQAMQQPLTLDAEAVVTGRNRPADNARRSIVQQFNALTKAQQDEVLAGYNNDPATFLARVQRMPTTGTQQLRNQLNRIAETAPTAPAVPAVAQELPPALAPLVAPTAPVAPAAQLKRGAASAAQVRQIEQGGVGQRADVGGRLAGQGQNRLQQAQKQAGGGQAGGRNRLVQGRAQAQTQVTPTAEAAPRPLEVAAAPVTAERVAPSAGPRVEADLTANLNAQIDRATTPAARQRLKVSLINRRNEAADAGRSTTELTAAIARLDEMAAEPVVEGVMGPGEPQSVWASLMDDDGTGYLNMSEDGRKAWDAEVRSNPIRPTRERAQFYQDSFLSEDTQKGLSYVRSLAGKLEKANDEQYLRITEKLNELSASDNKLVAAEATRALDGALGGEAAPEMTRRGFLRVAAASVITSIIPSRARALTPITDARLLGLLRSGDLNGALAHIAANSNNPVYRSLAATFLRTGVGGFKVRVLPTDSRSLQAMVNRGQIDMRTAVRAQNTYGFVQVERLNDLNVNLVDTKEAQTGLSEEVLLHETLHAWVMSRMFLFGMYGSPNNARLVGYTPDPNAKAAYDAARTEFRALETYLNENKASIPQADEFLREGGPISNADEFLAYGLTDVGFRNFLDSIAWDRRANRYVPKAEAPAGAQTALGRFFEWLSRLLFGNPTQASALERFTQMTEQLFRTEQAPDFTIAKKFIDYRRQLRGPSDDSGRFSLADWNTTGNARNLNGTAATPMVSGRARIIVQNFLSKLATKPNVTVVANQEELRRTNPALYQRAVAARPQGDFATAQAAGYSFGDGNVIIFTDRIANEQHLRFVLAHETFGHFGMRGIMPAARFDALMENIYETDSSARLAVDAAMEERGLTKAEATEEYLSDYAALLETSTVARIWNAIKGFLDRLGVKSGDIATRYFLDQSRRYVRQGAQGVTFDAQAVMNRLHAVEYGDTGTGRFSPQAAMRESAKVNLFLTQLGGFPRSLAEAWNDIQAQGGNIANVYDNIKAKFLSLANYRALENPGLSAFDGLMGKTNQISMSVKAALNEYLAPLLDAPKATRDKISRTMYDGRSYKISQFKASNMGKDPLFTIDDNGEFKANEAEQKRVFNAGLLKLDEIRNGYSYDREILGTDGKMTTEKQTVAPQKDFSDADYKLYVRARQAMFNVEMQLVQAEYASFLANKRLTSKEVSGLMKSDDLTADDRRFVDSMARHALALYTKNVTTDDSGNTVINPNSMKESSDFLEAVNAAFIGDRTDRNAAVRQFFESDAAANTFVDRLMDFKSRRKDITDANRFMLQNKVKQLILNQHNLNTRDRIARRAMMTGYTPVLRQGSYQMRLQAFVGDKPVEVKDAHQSLLTYSQFDNESSAINMAKQFNGELKGKSFDLLVRNDEGEFVPTRVTLRATTEVVIDAVAADPQLNLQEFLYGMNLFNINVNPTTMERLVTTLSRQEDSARRRLNYSQTPGFDPTSGIFAISRHIESRASTIAKASTRQALRELMNLDLAESRALWEGDAARVRMLQTEMDRLNADPNASQDAKRYAQQQLSQAQYQYRMTNPEGDVGRSRANLYYNQAASTLDYLEGSKFVDESNFGAGPVASRVRAFTSVWQLGGSIAQGALNLLSPYTNWMPYMASFNAKNGFGGGFGIGKVQAAYHTAFMQVGSKGLASMAMNRADFYDAVAKDPKLQKQYGLTVDEAQAIATEIREGKLIPAQSNALIATARGQTTSKWARNFIDTFMAPFNLSEQAARRSAFLAAYRLQRDRAIAAGKSAKEAQQEATDFAVKSIDLTLGEYSVLNRPPAWRAGVTSFIYMYKTYPTTTIQLLANLSRPAQLSMLAAIWALSGVAGLPFAEDFEDLIDTIAQGLGFRQGSIRAEMIRHIETSFPGWSATFFKGVVNTHGGPDIASRTSLGNLVPGTGAFLAGADVSREFADILGPAAGFISGTAKTARDLVVFPFSASKSLEDVARESPVTLLRLMGDSYAYMQSGAVVDRRGYVVSKEMDMGTIFTRLAGFYPASAAAQYDVIRIANRETDYQKEAVAGFRHAWIKATLRGDTQGAAAITASVNEWNNATRGTTLEIRNFTQGNIRALREAQRPAGERTLRAAPRAAQEDIRGLVDALTE